MISGVPFNIFVLVLEVRYTTQIDVILYYKESHCQFVADFLVFFFGGGGADF
jgi:hypothetical protein